LLNADGVDDAAAIDRRNDALDTDVALLIDSNLGNVGDVRVAKVSITCYAATASFRDRPTPAGFVADNFENSA
jgi:hypothetical protein